MRRSVVLALVMAAAGCGSSYYGDQPAVYGGGQSYYGDTAYGGADVDFYGQLSPYGQWVDTGYGQAWRPSVGGDFTPYATNGQWVSTDYGWAFDSSYPWGQIAFHYGNWYQDPRQGWVWYPGNQWAPAWVDWRYGDGYVGWTPLPPERFRAREAFERPDRWVFTDTRHFVDPGVGRYVRRDPTVYSRTQVVRNPVTIQGSTWNRGPQVERVESQAGRTVPRVRMQPPERVQRVRGTEPERQLMPQQQVPRPPAQQYQQPRQPAHPERQLMPQQQVPRPPAQQQQQYRSEPRQTYEQRHVQPQPQRPVKQQAKPQQQQKKTSTGATVHDHTND